MFIRLQPDQVTLFWDMIKQGMISSYKIPRKFQQDFAINALEQLLSGLSQAWIGFKFDEENNKKIHFIMTSKIIDEKHYGVRSLHIDSIYGFRLISEDMTSEIYEGMNEYAIANNCDIMTAEYSSKRVKHFLESHGFEDHKTTCRKIVRR